MYFICRLISQFTMKEKRNKIKNAALVLFVKRGFHNTPTSLIAKEAGVATGTLFHYFKTKEELINTLYLEIKDEMVVALAEKLDQHETIKAKMKQLFFNAVTWAVEMPEQQSFFMQFSNSPFIDKLTREEGQERFSGIFAVIEEGKNTDVLKKIPTPLMFEILQGMFNGTINYFLENKVEPDGQNKLEEVFPVFWDAIRG